MKLVLATLNRVSSRWQRIGTRWESVGVVDPAHPVATKDAVEHGEGRPSTRVRGALCPVSRYISVYSWIRPPERPDERRGIAACIVHGPVRCGQIETTLRALGVVVLDKHPKGVGAENTVLTVHPASDQW